MHALLQTSRSQWLTSSGAKDTSKHTGKSKHLLASSSESKPEERYATMVKGFIDQNNKIFLDNCTVYSCV
jgi:hypothetical protein